METLFLQAAESGEILLQFLWYPLLIWTIIGSVTWLILKQSDTVHPEYHYHVRLALIFSLPMGVIIMILLDQLSTLGTTATFSSSQLITFTAPFEITVTPSEESSAITYSTVLYAMSFITLLLGIIVSLGSFILQCGRLKKLRSNCNLTNIHNIDQLHSINSGLAIACRRPVKIAFLDSAIVPVTFGIRNPVILLPKSLQSHTKKLNLAIRHELTHIIQHDFLTHLAVVLTSAIFWFHPLIHRFKQELVEYREMRCDYRLLNEHHTVSRKEYATLLLELLPMPNIDKNLSANMAQESSNLKKRITMITQQLHNKPIPKRASLSLLGFLLISTVLVMACTDMQTQSVFDEEELNLMTDIDYSGERGYHQIIIYLGDEEQAQRHENLISQLNHLKPDHVSQINVLDKNEATDKYGSRGEQGIIEIQTLRKAEAVNTALRTLGMEEIDLEDPPPAPSHPNLSDDDYFMVVEQMPELIGGLSYVMKEIRYPQEAREAGMEGRVFVQFIVNENGDVENPKIIRSAGESLDNEALRVVKQAKFNPGMQRGEPVPVQYSLPIFFRLQGSDSTPEHSEYKSESESLDEMKVTAYGGNEDSKTSVNPEIFFHQTDIQNRSRLISERVNN